VRPLALAQLEELQELLSCSHVGVVDVQVLGSGPVLAAAGVS
jgi:hypothetical protein